MIEHIHEDSTGVCFRILYNKDAEGIEFVDARVLDAGYRSVGPDLLPFLHRVALILGDDSVKSSGHVEISRYLSIVTEDLP